MLVITILGSLRLTVRQPQREVDLKPRLRMPADEGVK